MLVGGNGVGKSTFYNLFLKHLGLPFVNADVLAKIAYPDQPEARSLDAAKLAEQIRMNLLLEGQSFCFETVYSHPSKIDFVAQAKSLGYEIIMVMIHLQQAGLNRSRVAQRVLEGGHFVPVDKINSRIPRTLKHIRMTLPLCDQFHAYDNSSADQPYQRVLSINNGIASRHIIPSPEWAEELLSTPTS